MFGKSCPRTIRKVSVPVWCAISDDDDDDDEALGTDFVVTAADAATSEAGLTSLAVGATGDDDDAPDRVAEVGLVDAGAVDIVDGDADADADADAADAGTAIVELKTPAGRGGGAGRPVDIAGGRGIGPGFDGRGKPGMPGTGPDMEAIAAGAATRLAALDASATETAGALLETDAANDTSTTNRPPALPPLVCISTVSSAPLTPLATTSVTSSSPLLMWSFDDRSSSHASSRT